LALWCRACCWWGSRPCPRWDAPCTSTSVERHDGLFDAALVVAAGDYEVLALDADLFGIGHVIDLVTALRRRPVTQGVAIIALSGVAEHRAQFLEAGGDMAIASPAELGAAVRWVTGAAVLQAPAPMANAAGA